MLLVLPNYLHDVLLFHKQARLSQTCLIAGLAGFHERRHVFTLIHQRFWTMMIGRSGVLSAIRIDNTKFEGSFDTGGVQCGMHQSMQ